MTARKPKEERAPPRTSEHLKKGLRVACEQAIAEVLTRSAESLWTLKELKTALRAARRRVLAEYGRRVVREGGEVHVVGGASAWRRAVVTVAGVPWRALKEPKQSDMSWRNR